MSLSWIGIQMNKNNNIKKLFQGTVSSPFGASLKSQWKPKIFGPVFLKTAISVHISMALAGQEENGFPLEKLGRQFQVFPLCFL